MKKKNLTNKPQKVKQAKKKRQVCQDKWKFPDGTDRPADKIIPFLDNPFVTGFHRDRLYYSKDFDVAMYKKITEEHMTYVEAYNALGFDTEILGSDRANAAGKRIMAKARDNKLFTIDETSYDGSVSPDKMGLLSSEEERAYLKARNHYLEEMLITQKKMQSDLEAYFTSSKDLMPKLTAL